MPPAGSSPTCDTAGVIQPIISVVAAVQVTEAIKILTGNVDKLHNSLMQFDVWQNEWRKIKLSQPQPDCPTCGLRKFESLNAENSNFEIVLCGRNAIQIAPPKLTEIDLESLAKRLENVAELKLNAYLLRFSVDEFEVTVFRDARAIVRGTDDSSVARSIYARYVGS
jgi:adenylyltransferase/sulfurtransferase